MNMQAIMRQAQNLQRDMMNEKFVNKNMAQYSP